MKNWQMSRRRMLRASGAVAVGLPLLEVMTGSKTAQAAAPRRFWYHQTPNGVVMNTFKPTGTETNFSFPTSLKPLEPLKNDLLLVFGMNNAANGKSQPGGGHYAASTTNLSGEPLRTGGKVKGGADSEGFDPGGITIDQAIAKSAAGNTRFRSLTWGHTGGFLVNVMSATRPGTFVPNEPDPARIYTRLFSELDVSGAGPSPALLKLRQRRASVLDLVKTQLTDLGAKVSTADKRTLDAHFDGIREAERSMDLAAAPAQNCQKPQMMSAAALAGESPALPQQIDVFMNLALYTFRCDLSRVITNMWVKASSRQVYSWLKIPDRHHDLSHNSSGPPMEKMTQIEAWWASVTAKFIQKLKDTPEGGGTMLDNTLVIWAHELSNADNHTSIDIPWVMAGNAGGRVRTGRFLNLPGRNTNDLLAGIGNVFDLNLTSFGRAEFNKSPLALG